MSRLAMFAAALVGLVSVVSASPIANNTALDKRVTHKGWATWYDAGLGACGYTDNDSEHVVAISHDIFGSGGNCNQIGQLLQACDATDLDFSKYLFEEFADTGVGKLEGVTWHFMAKGWSL
ncbi:hypothetical protein WOLCODRAFT_90050 [Wolfiporia cocos MD-104 SS10]|uniref:Uncharacterized protein n=1 Tax=Wolfiporia cocos (strain MD-104) TaxID=742152 RepID=A0A2H3JL28_WOLCO|nr:hypothetical protein WOLCODRAFT_90050 [Wolfiporia cocos MD-104 SS10]